MYGSNCVTTDKLQLDILDEFLHEHEGYCTIHDDIGHMLQNLIAEERSNYVQKMLQFTLNYLRSTGLLKVNE